MFNLIVKRLPAALVSLFGVLVIAFVLTRALPGDPAAYLAGGAASTEAIEEVRKNLGLDRPLLEQFGLYVRAVLRGELGQSWSTGQSVAKELQSRLPASIELTGLGLLVALALALPLGILAALRPGTWVDQACRLVTTAGVSLPTFFTGLLLVYVFYYLLGWLPAPMGRLPPFAEAPAHITGLFTVDSLLALDLALFAESVSFLVLPAVTLGLFALAPIARMTRAAMLGVLSSEYVRTARAAHLPYLKVLIVYALRNALLPIVTTLGMVFSFLLGASVLVEKVFSWPGLGSFALEALVISDYAAVQGFVLLMGVLYVCLNLVIDIVYILIDPRMRVES